MASREVVTHPLPDGSTAEVSPIPRSKGAASTISRMVDGECVWGQSFGMDTAEEHEAQVELVLSGMRSKPENYRRHNR